MTRGTMPRGLEQARRPVDFRHLFVDAAAFRIEQVAVVRGSLGSSGQALNSAHVQKTNTNPIV